MPTEKRRRYAAGGVSALQIAEGNSILWLCHRNNKTRNRNNRCRRSSRSTTTNKRNRSAKVCRPNRNY